MILLTFLADNLSIGNQHEYCYAPRDESNEPHAIHPLAVVVRNNCRY